MGRTLLKAVGFILLAVAIIYTSWWYLLARSVEIQIAPYHTKNAKGSLSFAESAVSGYPFNIMATILNPKIDELSMLAETNKAIITTWPRFPETVYWTIPEKTHIQLKAQKLKTGTIDFDQADGTIQLKLPEKDVTSTQSTIYNFRLQSPFVNHLLQPISIQTPKMMIEYQKTDSETEPYSITLSMAQAQVSGMQAYGFADGLDQFNLTLRPRGTVSMPLNYRNLATWRNNGGNVTLDKVNISWGKVKFNGSGLITLDQNLQPTGQIQGSLYGIDDLLLSLYHAEIISKELLGQTRTAFNLLSKRDSSGVAFNEFTLLINDRKLILGSIVIANLPEIIWN